MRRTSLYCALFASCLSLSAQAQDLSYLQGLLNATPAGGWVKASTNTFLSAAATGLDAAPPTPSGPMAVPLAWSGIAWDGARGNVMLFGGGHANYVGNEVYVWQGSDGRWTRGTLASRVDLSTGFVTGADAPQASHTYASTTYVPINDRLVVFGGSAWNSGGAPSDANGRTGPWWWDPALADPNKVGGADGTGWNSARSGSNSWQQRPYDPWVGLGPQQGRSLGWASSAYRSENNKDVVYLTMDSQGSGLPALFRYELGSPGTPDVWTQVGDSSGGTVQGPGAAAIDSSRGLYVRTALDYGSYANDLAVWDLTKNNSAQPWRNTEAGVQLVLADGTPWHIPASTSVAYDLVNDQLVLWDDTERGTVWATRPEYLSNGSLDPIWTVRKLLSATVDQPNGNFADGVLGKWKYAAELGAFVAMDVPNLKTGEVGIWLYKPTAAVPEPASMAMLLAGLLLIATLHRRRSR